MRPDAFAVVDSTLTPVVTSVDYLEALRHARASGDTQLVVPDAEAR
jgi:hypothetical protein